MPNTTDFDAVTGSTVYDSAGDKVGKVDQIYISNTTDLPVWVAVKTGLFGSSKSLVPLAGARHDGDRLDVKVTKDAIKDAPHLDADGGTSQEQNTELLRHYGLTDETAGWDNYGKHNAAANQAPPVGTAAGANAERTVDNGKPSVVRSEEQLNVSTERVQSGTARLRKYVVTEQETITVPVEREVVEIVREPVANARPGETQIGEDSAEVTLHEDKVTAHKDTVPVERVGLDVNTVKDTETVSDNVRKEQIDTEGIAGAKRDADPQR